MDRLLTLVELEWKREAAYECYRRKALQSAEKFNATLKDKGIKDGDLVLKYDNRLDNRFDAKFEARWQGPYIVKKIFNSSYYQLMDLDGKEHSKKVNGYRLKPYLSRILPKELEKHQKATSSSKSCSLIHVRSSSQDDQELQNENLAEAPKITKDLKPLSLEKMPYDGT